jgi:2-polyprenyl-3-methyl-5-hydroxy-6-metoxy-1,4-benzoquinol methylase
MDDLQRRQFIARVRDFQAREDPSGWCDQVYLDAQGDVNAVFWADRVANPYLLAWLAEHPAPTQPLRAITVGCGVGDDAEALAAHGYAVTAFDISPAAIALCRARFPDSQVDYCVADLFECPAAWAQQFDLVFECNTIQIMAGAYRIGALNAIAGLVAPDGDVLASCRSRAVGSQLDAFPLPLDQTEIDGFVRAGLAQTAFITYDDDQQPPVPHFFACYHRLPA